MKTSPKPKVWLVAACTCLARAPGGSEMMHLGSIRKFRIMAVALLAGGLTQIAAPQDASEAQQMIQQRIATIKESLAANQAALRQYSWVETTEMKLKGEVKNHRQNECRYGPDGQVQKTPVGQPQEAKQRRGVRGRIVEKKVGEVTDYMERVGSLVGRYVPPDPNRMREALQAGKASRRELSGGARQALVFTDYAKSGDEMALVFDPETRKLRDINVATWLDSTADTVTLSVHFDSLADGANYVAETILDATAKQIEIKTTNFGHRKTSGQ